MKRTNLVLDEHFLEEAVRLSGERTYSRAVERAHAVHLYRAARLAGFSIRSGVDCVIAACALRHGLILAHHDRDFEALACVSALRTREVLA